MTSVIASAAQAAHSVATSLLSTAQVQPGGTIPASQVKEDEPAKTEPLILTGKNIIVGVPGAFTGTCHAQVPGYIKEFVQFKQKGINNVYIVAVNDVFVMKAWKAQLAPEGTPVHFIADDKASFVGSLGLVFDATPVLGGPRSKRFVIITDGDKVESIAVEPDSSKLTVTAADVILAQVS
ncbi:Redoxin [Crucibulum laeve]|uniref:Redoxin n=1 Tax=Crucibulum laeve TaxID=68775 RepID=A0A5C3LU20_9AGAR|nr:Redoxin [Crucibulum laeve]